MNTIRIGNIRTSTEEIQHLIKAWLAISLAFGILLANDLFSLNFTSTLIVSAITVGLGFLLHELAHKVVAQKYHYSAEFRSNNIMLILAILMSFFGFIFAAPGAVMIKAYYIDKRKNGKISLAGPLANIVLAIIFIVLKILITPTSIFLQNILLYGPLINIWLAIFNMIPVWNLDGKKVLNWSKTVYFSTLVIAIFLLIVNTLL
tara:strand:+ start:2550 stop:3161 length:612 start_codon:yes stop_codon:yes gene_type:complete